MKLFVTGSDGYIGIHLVQVLLAQGHFVTGLDTGYFRSGWLYNGISHVPEIISHDIRSITKEELGGYDAVVHLAEISNDTVGAINPDVTRDINHAGTMRLANLAKAAGVPKFIYFSSCSVYGASDGIADESSPTNPLTTYAECKVLNENGLRAMADDTFSPVLLRNATAFGASPRMRFDIVINNLAGRAWTTKEVKMDSDGSPWRPFVHVLDICEAVVCALAAPRDAVHNQTFNVGSSRSNYQIKTIAEIISGIFPDCSVSLNKDGKDKRNYRVNFDKINAKLPGFSCKHTVEKGVAELKTIFEHVSLAKDAFESKEYTRLRQIRYLLEAGRLDENLFWKPIAL